MNNQAGPGYTSTVVVPSNNRNAVASGFGLWVVNDSLKHIIPMGISIFLIWMNATETWWFQGERIMDGLVSQTTISNLLQFAAKLYELLVIASLAAMALNVAKRCMIGEGLPFGLATGAYRVGDVEYFISSSFWKGCRTRRLAGMVGLLLFVCTFMAVLVGPASAILMVPTLGWWTLHNPFSKITMPVYYYNVQPLWPAQVNDSLVYSWLHCNSSNYHPIGCPASGYPEISTWVEGWRHSALRTNIGLRDQSTNKTRLIVTSGHAGNTWATTLTMSSVTTIGSFITWAQENDVGPVSVTERSRLRLADSTPQYQPLGQVYCRTYDKAAALKDQKIWQQTGNVTANIPIFGMGYVPPANVWNSTLTPNLLRFSWLNHTSEPGRLFAMALIPYVKNKTDFASWIVGCELGARWEPTSLTVDTGNLDQVQSNVTDLVMSGTHDLNIIQGPNKVQIGMSWAEMLNVPTNDTTNAGKWTTIERMILSILRETSVVHDDMFLYDFAPKNPEKYDGSDRDIVSYMVSKILNSVLVEGLARMDSGQSALILEPGNDHEAVNVTFVAGRLLENSDLEVEFKGPEEMKKLTNELEKFSSFDFTVQRYGYGSGAAVPTVWFALVVVYVYLSIIFVYFLILWVYYFRRGKVNAVTKWGDIQDLLALALHSRIPDEFRHLGEAVSKSMKQTDIKIRASMANGLEIVTFEDQDTRSTVQRRSFTTFDDSLGTDTEVFLPNKFVGSHYAF